MKLQLRHDSEGGWDVYIFFGFLGLIIFVVFKNVWTSLKHEKSNSRSGSSYTPASDVYSGKQRKFDEIPKEESTKKADYVVKDTKASEDPVIFLDEESRG